MTMTTTRAATRAATTRHWRRSPCPHLSFLLVLPPAERVKGPSRPLAATLLPFFKKLDKNVIRSRF